ncbi:hypothetical protein EV368DRAFT_19352, partial [Lentinula lateritia]
TIKIAHGQLLHFQSADVQDPRQISFATNISCLEHVWDNKGPNWDPVDCGTNLLSINSTPIALRYWPEKNWTEWKFVVEQYCTSPPDVFWKEFS